MIGHIELLRELDRGDLEASLRFIALVAILVVLPNHEFDVLFGLNPQRVWLVVVFIAGLSFLGYLLSKVVDPATAIGVTGVLGGCVSPGLTITSLSEQTRRHPEFSSVYVFAAASAVTMLFPRNLVVVGIVSPSLALSLLMPFVVMAAVGVTVASAVWLRNRNRGPENAELDTPFRIRTALVFGAIIASIMVAIGVLDLSIPPDTTRLGIVLVTTVEMSSYVGFAWTTGARQMARTLAVILLGSVSLGGTLVLLT